jgi:tetratricopeptide (TPR) repeat protein
MFSGARVGGGGDDAAGPDAHLSDLFSRLHQSVEDRAHKRASKLCDEILKVSPGDVDASRAKVVALVESARYADAVAFLERSDDAELKASLAFEHAYALYRSHRLEEALAMVAPPRGSSPAAPREHRVAQLEAQLLYRLGRPAEAADAYERVLGSSPTTGRRGDHHDGEPGRRARGEPPPRRRRQALRRRDVSPKASFEIAFNVACGLIAQREFEDARAYLALAKAQGDAALRDEGLAPEEIAEEMLPAECAAALCAAALGARDEAVRGYLGVLGFTSRRRGTNAGTNAGRRNANTNVNAGGTNVNAGSHHSRDHATLAVAATNLAALLGARGLARRRVPAPRREALRRGRRFARGRLGARRVRDDARRGGAQPRGGARARQPSRAGQRDVRRREVAAAAASPPPRRSPRRRRRASASRETRATRFEPPSGTRARAATPSPCATCC